MATALTNVAMCNRVWTFFENNLAIRKKCLRETVGVIGVIASLRIIIGVGSNNIQNVHLRDLFMNMIRFF